MKRTLFLALLIFTSFAFAAGEPPALNAEMQKNITPDQTLQRLISGNAYFINHETITKNYRQNKRLTAAAQYPAAVVLSCMDSRVPPEVVFNQNIGDIFVLRSAGNVVDSDVLGGMEYATKVVGAKLIVVMGHDSCGAVAGACKNVEMGNLTQLVEKIDPAIATAKKSLNTQNCDSDELINTAARDNVLNMIQEIQKRSPIIRELIKHGQVKIVGAVYRVATGKVSFLNS